MDPIWWLCLLMFIVAALYASVGHGGASGYIALFTLFQYSSTVIKPVALVLNLIVSLLAFYHFYKAGHFKWKLFYPFAMASVPASYLGGVLTLDDQIFRRILGIILIVPVLNFLGFFNGKVETPLQRIYLPLAFVVGGIIGFLSGLIGIGGGIFLTPFLLMMRWGGVKEVAAVSALYIFVNSMSGLLGQHVAGVRPDNSILILIPFIFTGGFTGASFGAGKLNPLVLKKILALVLLIASFKLIIV